jgi:hypothetical protein
MIDFQRGTTRIVVLTKQWAFKFPMIGRGWQYFLCGLLANMQERHYSRAIGRDLYKLCRVVFRIPFGFMVVMRNARPLSAQEFAVWEHNYNSFVKCDAGYLPDERKASSFGWIEGRVVAIDYGCTAEVFAVSNLPYQSIRPSPGAKCDCQLRSRITAESNLI